MNLRNLRLSSINYITKVRCMANAYKYKKFVKNEIKKGNCYQGSEEEFKDKVLPYWDKISNNTYRPQKYWYQYYGNRLQKFDPKIIPMDLFQNEIMPYLNNFLLQDAIENKCYFDCIMGDINKAKEVVKHINGLLLDANNKLISFSDLESILKNYKQLIIKPIDGEKGHGIKKLYLDKDYLSVIKEIKERMKNEEFIIQEIIDQSPQLNSFNESSVNTRRVLSLLMKDRVEILSAIVRVGSKGSEVDNYSQGGDCRPIDIKTNKLKGYMMKGDRFFNQDSQGKEIGEPKILGFDKVIETVKKIHPRVPHLRWVGWDIAIDKNLEPVFIELNGLAGENQSEDGPIFGDITDEFLTEFFNYRNKKS